MLRHLKHGLCNPPAAAAATAAAAAAAAAAEKTRMGDHSLTSTRLSETPSTNKKCGCQEKCDHLCARELRGALPDGRPREVGDAAVEPVLWQQTGTRVSLG